MRHFFHKRILSWPTLLCSLFVTLFCLGFVTSIPAYADAGRDIVSQRSVNVPRGEIAEQVLVIGNDATISGVVSDTLVVVNGNIHLTPTAKAGIVIDLGGHLTQDPGSRANTVYTLSFNTPFLNSLSVGSTLVVAVWGMRLVMSAALLAFPVILAMILRTRLEPSVSYIQSSVRRAGLTGLLGSIAFLILTGITAITVVGLPVTAILVLLYEIIGLVGLACVSIWLSRTANFGSIQQRPIWLQTLIGVTIIMAFGNIPLVGPILIMIAWLVGVGAVTMLVWQRWQSRKTKRAPSGT